MASEVNYSRLLKQCLAQRGEILALAGKEKAQRDQCTELFKKSQADLQLAESQFQAAVVKKDESTSPYFYVGGFIAGIAAGIFISR